MYINLSNAQVQILNKQLLKRSAITTFILKCEWKVKGKMSGSMLRTVSQVIRFSHMYLR